MPEQISKYPDVTLEVLKGEGARCGEGAKQRILTKCPEQNFCSLKTGEICVYGIKDIPKMTQISTQELAQVVCTKEQIASKGPFGFSSFQIGVLAFIFLTGLIIGLKFKKIRNT